MRDRWHPNQFLFKSSSFSKKLKTKLYWSTIKPTVTYVCETWVLRETIGTWVIVFERKVLRNIFGPTKERDGTWRIKTNDELDKLIRNKNIINYTGCHRRNGPNFGRVFLMLNYTDITQNTYIQS